MQNLKNVLQTGSILTVNYTDTPKLDFVFGQRVKKHDADDFRGGLHFPIFNTCTGSVS